MLDHREAERDALGIRDRIQPLRHPQDETVPSGIRRRQQQLHADAIDALRLVERCRVRLRGVCERGQERGRDQDRGEEPGLDADAEQQPGFRRDARARPLPAFGAEAPLVQRSGRTASRVRLATGRCPSRDGDESRDGGCAAEQCSRRAADPRRSRAGVFQRGGISPDARGRRPGRTQQRSRTALHPSSR